MITDPLADSPETSADRAALASQLELAVKDGDAQEVARLVKLNPEPMAFGISRNTPLHTAVAQGHVDCVKILAEHADPHVKNRNGYAPIHLAAELGHLDCLEALLDKSDLSSKTSNGNTALMIAAERGQIDLVQALLEFDPSLAQHADKRGRTALIKAADGGRADCLRALLPHSDARHQDQQGDSALMRAASGGNLECACLLMGSSDLSAVNRRGLNAAGCAESRNFLANSAAIQEALHAESERRMLQEATAAGGRPKARSASRTL